MWMPKNYNLLNFSFKERSSKANINTILMLIIKGMSILINLAYVPLLIHSLNVEEYGIWLSLTTIISWISFFDIGLGHGLRNKFAVAIAQNNKELAKTYVSTAYIIMSSIALGLFVLAVIVVPLINWTFVLNAPVDMKAELNMLAFWIISLFCVNFVLNLLNSVMIALQMPAISSLIITLGQLLSFLIIYVITAIGLPSSLLNLGIIISLSPILVLIISSLIIFGGKYKIYAPSFAMFNRSCIKPIVSLGFKFFAVQMTALLLFQTNNLIIAHTVGNVGVAEFNIAYKYLGIINMIFAIIVTPYWSAATDAYAKNDFNWIRKNIKWLNIVWVVMLTGGFVLILIAKFSYSLWIGNSVDVNYGLLILMFIYYAVYMRWTLYGSFINGIGKISLQFFITLGEAAVHIPLAVFLGYQWGIIGIVIAMIITSFANIIWPPIQIKKILAGKSGIWAK
jgi:O-antigen/teichoic acid export membrane protein